MNVWNILEQNKEFDDLYIQRLFVEGLLGKPPTRHNPTFLYASLFCQGKMVTDHMARDT